MAAKIISVANQKGGCGKSTTVMHLGGALAKLTGRRVLIVDADKQNSCTKWSANAPDDKPFPAVVTNLAPAGAKIHREIQKSFELYDYILVDCPPNMESVIPASALLISDLAILVMQPTTTDLASLSDFLIMVEQMKTTNQSLQSRVLVNRYRKNALAELTLGKIRERGIPQMRITLGDRVAYAEGDTRGSHILEQKGAPAAAKYEMKELVAEILELLGEGGEDE